MRRPAPPPRRPSRRSPRERDHASTGSFWTICFVASIPSRSGIRRSIRTTDGRNSCARRTPSCPGKLARPPEYRPPPGASSRARPKQIVVVNDENADRRPRIAAIARNHRAIAPLSPDIDHHCHARHVNTTSRRALCGATALPDWVLARWRPETTTHLWSITQAGGALMSAALPGPRLSVAESAFNSVNGSLGVAPYSVAVPELPYIP